MFFTTLRGIPPVTLFFPTAFIRFSYPSIRDTWLPEDDANLMAEPSLSNWDRARCFADWTTRPPSSSEEEEVTSTQSRTPRPVRARVRPLPESFDEEEDELELELPDEEEDEEEEEFDEESLSSLSSDVSTPPAAQKRLMVAVVWSKKQDRMN